jgi:hypothetical protein
VPARDEFEKRLNFYYKKARSCDILLIVCLVMPLFYHVALAYGRMGALFLVGKKDDIKSRRSYCGIFKKRSGSI